jgi:hypothetical protein
VEKAEKTKKLLSTFLRRLTNLSGNNRSLFLLKPSEQFIDLHSFSHLSGEKSFSIIEALLKEGKKIICPVADARMPSANTASVALKKLFRNDQFIFEERGSRDLHVGWPFVRGKFSDGTLVRCPLLFFPVELSVDNNNWFLQFRNDAELVFNKSFLLAYSFYNKIKIDENLLNETFEETDRNSTAFLTKLYNILTQSSIELNFNPDIYSDELSEFRKFAKSEFAESYPVGQLKVFSEAILGIFPQAGSSLVPDYIQLIEENLFQDLEEFFSKHQLGAIARTENFISLVREEKVYTVFPSDIWQENAIKASKLGHSIVVQGPPGTGKSQLIANLVSDGIANAKRVLVVCQKRAALDVVYDRLKEKSMENFLALVHDYKSDRKEILQKLAFQINRTDEYKSKNISLDAIQLERKHLQISRRIDQITEELEHFRHSLFDESECDRCVKELYLQCDANDPFIAMKQEYSHFKFNEIHFFLRSIKQYADYAIPFEDDSYLWLDRKSFAEFSIGDLAQIKSAIREVPPFYNEISQQLSKTLNASPDIEQLITLGERIEDLKTLANTTSENDLFQYFKRMLLEKSNETSALWLSNLERLIMDCFTDVGPEVSVPTALLGYFQKALHRSMKARKGLWSWLRWRLFSNDKMMITRALVANQLQSDNESFKILERKLDQRLNFEHNLSKLKNKKWLLNIPDTISRQHFIEWFAKQQKTIKAKLLFNSIRGLKSLLNPLNLKEIEFRTKIHSLIQSLEQVQVKVRIWSPYLRTSQINKLSRSTEHGEQLIRLLSLDFDALCEFDKLKTTLSEGELQIIQKLKEKSQDNKGEDWQKIFLNSLGLAWIDHIETKYPELRIVSSAKVHTLENELQEQIELKQNLSNEILLLRARECVTNDLEFNRLHNRVSYRDLLHQATKKKKIWPLRKVISEFEDEIFKLLPCWMASPESVSAIFPMKEIFDLVIFDEASQCFAERGIPALYRGKQAVIAGDSQQLRPGDFYQARWQEEDFEEPDAEVDSLLELTSRYLMTLKLNGHYRSQSLELIDFSNKHFYEGKLQLLPDFHQVNKQESSIEFIKVEGIWENNSNELEASTIADLVLKITQEKPLKEIGVITFNSIQQSLVQDRVEEKFSIAQLKIPERLFIKNIENVQGDERDIIIFSIGYAPDKKGKVSVQFGSLNINGGENRLNVAVSRAREKIIVVSSLWPEQLEVNETKNAGPRLLKEYLNFARQVSINDFTPYVGKDNNSSQLDQLKNRIVTHANKSQIELKEDAYPFYDLTVQQGKLFKGAIFTDDNFYYESLSAKAPHALLPQLLKKKNWPNLRVYSRNFWNDKKKLLNELKEL